MEDIWGGYIIFEIGEKSQTATPVFAISTVSYLENERTYRASGPTKMFAIINFCHKMLPRKISRWTV